MSEPVAAPEARRERMAAGVVALVIVTVIVGRVVVAVILALAVTGFEHPRPTQPGQPAPMMRAHGSVQTLTDTLIDDTKPRRGTHCLPRACIIAQSTRPLHGVHLPAPPPNKRASASMRGDARTSQKRHFGASVPQYAGRSR
jgi:hypothetical protein